MEDSGKISYPSNEGTGSGLVKYEIDPDVTKAMEDILKLPQVPEDKPKKKPRKPIKVLR